MEEAKTIKQSGKCVCGAVEYTLDGPYMFNGLCHCKACTINAGSGPVHLIGAAHSTWSFQKGEDNLEICKGYFGKMYVAKCKTCMAPVYQGPEGGPFKAAFPRMFQISDGKSCKLPAELMPQAHLNYENRLWDCNDDLPKMGCFSDPVNNNGTPKA